MLATFPRIIKEVLEATAVVPEDGRLDTTVCFAEAGTVLTAFHFAISFRTGIPALQSTLLEKRRVKRENRRKTGDERNILCIKNIWLEGYVTGLSGSLNNLVDSSNFYKLSV
jgi:hypothetical protein